MSQNVVCPRITWGLTDSYQVWGGPEILPFSNLPGDTRVTGCETEFEYQVPKPLFSHLAVLVDQLVHFRTAVTTIFSPSHDLPHWRGGATLLISNLTLHLTSRPEACLSPPCCQFWEDSRCWDIEFIPPTKTKIFVY